MSGVLRSKSNGLEFFDVSFSPACNIGLLFIGSQFFMSGVLRSKSNGLEFFDVCSIFVIEIIEIIID
jgi:hypothetical protein